MRVLKCTAERDRLRAMYTHTTYTIFFHSAAFYPSRPLKQTAVALMANTEETTAYIYRNVCMCIRASWANSIVVALSLHASASDEMEWISRPGNGFLQRRRKVRLAAIKSSTQTITDAIYFERKTLILWVEISFMLSVHMHDLWFAREKRSPSKLNRLFSSYYI